MQHLTIEAVTVCVNYGDILEQMAPHNRPLLDRWVVVTSPEDKKTRAVCRAFSIECQLTQDFDRGGAFPKARGINRGLDMLTGDDSWLLHLDADIALPFDFRLCLDSAHLHPDCLYGCDRINVTGEEAWAAVLEKGLYSREQGWLAEKNRPQTWVGGVPAGPETGYVPIGFFQLWHSSKTLTWEFPRRRYPEQHGNAARTDVQFGLQWDRRHRIHLPELLVFHLESEPARMGANWNGRKTRPFDMAAYRRRKCPPCPPCPDCPPPYHHGQ
jgi:hypothetical protein